MNWINAHRKFLAAIAGGVVAVIDSLYGSGSTVALAVISVLTALGVYGATNA